MRPALIFLMLCSAALPVRAAEPSIEAGKRAFARCANCHQVGPGASSGFGPQLNGIVGRRAGAAPGFAYSPAMKNARIVWDDKTLAAFLRDPDEVVPGNKMRFWGMLGERQVADLLTYLRAHPAPSAAAPLTAPLTAPVTAPATARAAPRAGATAQKAAK